ncbi:SprT-like domain-containing protein [Sulfurimonas sp.]|uniref:SprT-like domain-containing protein n=1 Tax=Sulfurimonas sp. TaxID=2022749 RepID=UPI00356A0D7F
MFVKKLEYAFILLTITALIYLSKNYYDDYQFKHNDIPQSYKNRISKKENEVLTLMQQHYGRAYKVPLIVTDKFKGRLYGLTVYKDGDVKIYLNKNVMQESIDYMVESVIAHEYAHALMFKLGDFSIKDEGHSKVWKDACIKLGGVGCAQYVNTNDVVMGKLPF